MLHLNQLSLKLELLQKLMFPRLQLLLLECQRHQLLLSELRKLELLRHQLLLSELQKLELLRLQLLLSKLQKLELQRLQLQLLSAGRIRQHRSDEFLPLERLKGELRLQVELLPAATMHP